MCKVFSARTGKPHSAALPDSQALLQHHINLRLTRNPKNQFLQAAIKFKPAKSVIPVGF
ncbi:MAG: hypothetical protein Q4D82_07825 [Neisseria sp.]|nr:hypothetical protein [Neisseria sp.]